MACIGLESGFCGASVRSAARSDRQIPAGPPKVESRMHNPRRRNIIIYLNIVTVLISCRAPSRSRYVVSAEESDRKTERTGSLAEFLLASPSPGQPFHTKAQFRGRYCAERNDPSASCNHCTTPAFGSGLASSESTFVSKKDLTVQSSSAPTRA
jgi:hypothetical protein